MSSIQECERNTCNCAEGKTARLFFVCVCETSACPERTFGFVTEIRGMPCRACHRPTTVKHSMVQGETNMDPIASGVCQCGHWYEEHTRELTCEAPGCACSSFVYSPEENTPEAIAERR